MAELTVEALVRKLSKQYITVSALRKGDVVVADYGSWLVDSTTAEPNGFFTVVDEDGNGFVNVPGSDICVIVERGCFR